MDFLAFRLSRYVHAAAPSKLIVTLPCISRTPLAAAAALTAAALISLPAARNLPSPTSTLRPPPAEESQEQAEETPEAVTETFTETQQPAVTDIYDDTFKVDPAAYTKFATGTSSNGCVAPAHEDRENDPVYQCGVNLTTPQTAFTDLGYPVPGKKHHRLPIRPRHRFQHVQRR